MLPSATCLRHVSTTPESDWQLPPRRRNRTFIDARKIVANKDLSTREMEILRLAALGDTTSEIGRRLGIATETVKQHRKRVLWKLEARNFHHAIHIAHLKGLLGTNSPSPGNNRFPT